MKLIHTCIAALTLLCAIPSHAQSPIEIVVEGRRYSLTLTPLDAGVGPKAPTELIAARQAASVDLAWADNSSDETGFAIWRQSGANTWTKLALLAKDAVRFTDWMAPFGAASGTYRVQSIGETGASPFSNEASVALGVQARLLQDGPVIHSVRPPIAVPLEFARNAKALSLWEINGTGFGSEAGQVMFNFLPTAHLAWSDRRIMVTEPPTDCTITVRTADGRWYSGLHRHGAAE